MLFTPRLFALNGAALTEGDEQNNSPQATTLRKPALIGQSICVVPRGECSFRRVRLAGTGRDAVAAAKLKARNEALPDEDGACIVVDSAPADSPSGISTLMAGIWGYSTSRHHTGRYLPESLAQTPHPDGARLVRGLSGFEGQIWDNANLRASRWWAGQPRSSDWDGFIRAAQETFGLLDRGPLDMALPVAVDVPWRDDIPVFDIDKDRLSQVFSPKNVGLIAATLVGCTSLYISGQFAREKIAHNAVSNAAAELRGDTEEIQSQRRRALTNMSYVRRYRALGDNGTILAALASIAEVIGQTDLGIERATLRDGALELRLKGEDEISVPDVVSLLEAKASLTNVTVSLETIGAIIIKADINAPSMVVSAPPAPAPTKTGGL